MKPYVFILIALLSLNSYSQQSFEPGEKLKYDVYYKIAFIWVDAAYVNLEVEETTYRSKKYYRFNATGSSKPNYDWIFRVRDYFTSVAERDGLAPIKFQRNTSEGDYKVNNNYIFDHKNKKVYSTVQRNKHKAFSDTLDISPPIQDIISTAYRIRNIDFTKLNKGDSLHIRTIVDNEVFDTDVWYMGEEWVEHKNKKKYPAYKFRSKGLEGSMFDKKDYITVWVSRDQNKIPIKVEAGIIVGKVLVYLNSAEIPNESPFGLLTDF